MRDDRGFDIDLLPELPEPLGIATGDETAAGQPCTETGILVAIIGAMM